MKISRKSQLSGKTHVLDLDVTAAQIAELQSPRRRNIQDIFPNLTDSEREFLLTGITEQEWNNLFKKEA